MQETILIEQDQPVVVNPVPAPAPSMTLCSYGSKLTREELSRVKTPAATATHKPIPHIAVVEKHIVGDAFPLMTSNSGTLTIVNCTVTGNRAEGARQFGGGGGSISSLGTLTILNTTLNRNGASPAKMSVRRSSFHLLVRNAGHRPRHASDGSATQR